MNTIDKIRELQKTSDTIREQIKKLQNESSDDRYIYGGNLIVKGDERHNLIQSSLVKMPMIKVMNKKRKNNKDSFFCKGDKFISVLDKMNIGDGVECNVYLHIEIIKKEKK